VPGTLSVWLNDRHVGDLTNLPGDDNIFAFTEDFLEDPDPPVLSQSFIGTAGALLRRIPRVHTLAPPFFSNLLPEENAALRNIVARQDNIGLASDFPFLRVLGGDLPGAVILRSPNEAAQPAAIHLEASAVDISERVRFSLAGVQLKFSASLVGDRLTIPAVVAGADWIVKLPTTVYPHVTTNEYAMMAFARSIGLNVPDIRLFDLTEIDGLPRGLPMLPPDERKAYAIRRFDRSPEGRIHAEDMNQVANQFPRDKYEHKNASWVANVVQTLCDSADVDEFVARIVFGLAIGNNDMHLKNWALIYPDGHHARLAPMYDFVCTTLYMPGARFWLSLGGEHEFSRVSKRTIESFAAGAEISVRRALRVAEQTAQRVRDTWPAIRGTIESQRLVAAVERNIANVPLLHEA
jgi:serine/threonine-protein kinase HipA